MSSKEERKRGLLLPFAGKENETLGREFLDNPEHFLRSRGMGVEDLVCPAEAHDALQRGRNFAADVESAEFQPDLKSIESLKEVAARHFGRNYTAALIPFGIKFSERIVEKPGVEWTATGTGSVTFRWDTDHDGDG